MILFIGKKWVLEFERGRLALSNKPVKKGTQLRFAVYVPWVYYDPEEGDGWGGINKVFKAEATTVVEMARDPELDFTYARVSLLGFGLSFSMQIH